MNSILCLLRREWIEFKKYSITIILFWIIFPIILHICLAIPLSNLIKLNIRYLNWSSAGVWIVVSSIMAFMVTSKHLIKFRNEDHQIEAILQTPITNFNLLFSIFIKGLIYGLLQFFIALILISTLNHEYYSMLQYSQILIQIISIIATFSVFGMFLGLILNNVISLVYSTIILFVVLTFGTGTFIPLNNYPVNYINFIDKIPFIHIVSNIKAIVINEPIYWIGFFLSILMTILLMIISLIVSYRVFRVL